MGITTEGVFGIALWGFLPRSVFLFVLSAPCWNKGRAVTISIQVRSAYGPHEGRAGKGCVVSSAMTV